MVTTIKKQELVRLLDSEALLRTALAAASAGSWSLDPATGEVQWSKELFDLFGIDPGTAASTEAAVARMHPDDAATLVARRDEQLARGGQVDLEYRVLHPTRGTRWLHARGRRMPDGRVLGITMDVTERRLVDDRLRLVMDAVPALISYVDADLRYRFNNHAYEEWFGVSRNHFVGMSMKEALGEAAFARLKPRIDLVLAGQHVKFESELRYRFGGTRYVQVEYVPDQRADDNVVGFYVFVTDLSERRKAEEAQAEQLAVVRASEERFREMADAAPAVLWLTDETNRLTFISRGWFEHTGQSMDDAYDRGTGWMNMVHPEDRQAADEAFLSAAEKRIPFELEYRLRREDGSYRWALDAGRPRFSKDGSWRGYIGSVIDIHESVQARDSLREADRRKDEFLALLAHELRNPLAPISNALHLLNTPGGSVHLERVREMLARQVNHMVRLVDDLMEASRITRGKLELKREVMDLRDALRAAVETARPLVDRSHHALQVMLPDETLPVYGDAVRLAQVFANLLNNAAKYTPNGGHLSLTALRDDKLVRVCVRDNGIGIEAHNLPRVFEMFVQLDHGHARAQGGLGIGLSLARRIVEMHGGSISAASEGDSRGSEFTVKLPMVMARVGPGVEMPSGDQAFRRRVLIVDDNRDAADSLAMLLVALGADVRVANDGPASLKIPAPDWRPDLVFLDLGMPDMDGFEVVRRMRADPAFAGTRVVALTGWSQDEDKRRTAGEGFDGHIVKPVGLSELHAVLANLEQRVDK
jgi:PAS domain S-box-containing protein